jgi:MoxR-like ATPase
LIGSQYDPAELAGWALPVEGTEDMKRSKPDWWPDGAKPTLLVLDELPQSSTSVQNIFAQLTNERRIGKRQLPDNVAIAAAGNRLSDKAGTTTMPTHLRDRLMFLSVEADAEDVIAHFNRIGADERVCAYLRHRPEMLHEFELYRVMSSKQEESVLNTMY